MCANVTLAGEKNCGPNFKEALIALIKSAPKIFRSHANFFLWESIFYTSAPTCSPEIGTQLKRSSWKFCNLNNSQKKNGCVFNDPRISNIINIAKKSQPLHRNWPPQRHNCSARGAAKPVSGRARIIKRYTQSTNPTRHVTTLVNFYFLISFRAWYIIRIKPLNEHHNKRLQRWTSQGSWCVLIGRKFSECEKQQPSERAASGGMDWNARERTSECERLGSSSKPFDLWRSAQMCAWCALRAICILEIFAKYLLII
jgi:hypothetical protein